jgi:hypothetical protein
MTYQTADGGVLRSDGAFVPNDQNNTDWRTYLAWVAAGNTTLPPDPLPVVALEDRISTGALVRKLLGKGVLKLADL